jgi:hypothetical protein
MSDFDASSIASLDSQQFAKAVKTTPDDQLKQVMESDQRGKVLDEIFGRMPKSFRPDRAGSTNAVIHWIVGGRSDGGSDTYELVIANGACTLSPQPTAEPKLSLTVPNPVDFLKVISGNTNPVTAFMMGKLKAKGDLGLAANIANLFETPKA